MLVLSRFGPIQRSRRQKNITVGWDEDHQKTEQRAKIEMIQVMCCFYEKEPRKSDEKNDAVDEVKKACHDTNSREKHGLCDELNI